MSDHWLLIWKRCPHDATKMRVTKRTWWGGIKELTCRTCGRRYE